MNDETSRKGKIKSNGGIFHIKIMPEYHGIFKCTEI